MNFETIQKSYQFISVIGKGSFAKVLLAKFKSNGRFFALKCMKKKQFRHKNKENRLFQQKQILKQVEHPFIVKLFASYQTQQFLIFSLSYCSGGDLYSQLRNKKRLSEQQILFYTAQIILAIQYMHSKNIIYRDLKPENVLINCDGYIQLTDFGLSKTRIMSNEFRTFSVCGTPEYLSPQILMEEGHGKAFDWWCLGMIIYQLSHGRPAFIQKNQNALFQKIIQTEPCYDNQLSPDLEQVIKKLLLKNQKERLEISKKLKSLNFYSKINFQQLMMKKIKPPFIPDLQNEEDLKYFYKPFTQLDMNFFDTNDKTKYRFFEDFNYVSPQMQLQQKIKEKNMNVSNNEKQILKLSKSEQKD